MIRKLFEILNSKYPPEGSKNHSLILNHKTGFFVLTVWINDKMEKFELDDHELEDPDLLLSEIKRLLNEQTNTDRSL